ncbi:MAG: DUF4328 domain-containing protein [Methylobacterium mesophilicum]|nr:DUF4328 domain-containing protein [Methylobacterium mesophilicum]
MSSSFQGLTERLVRILWIVFAIDVVALVFDLWERLVVFRMLDGTAGAEIDAAVAASDSRQMVVGYLQIGFFVTAAVLAATWMRRANVNARTLGAEGMRFTPNWSIVWYVIPFANLVMPYKSMAETWRASSGQFDWQKETVPDFLRYWWGLWLLANAAGQVAARLTLDASAPQALLVANAAYIVADGLSAILDLVFLQLVQELSKRQSETAARKVVQRPG